MRPRARRQIRNASGPVLILASASPRRRDILTSAGIAFLVRPSETDESPRPGESPQEQVQRLAEAKARAVWRAGETTLGADTVVVTGGQILGKPADAEDARRMLRLLSGRAHSVLTAVCFFDGKEAQSAVEETRVHFLKLSEQEIAGYVSSGEPFDKAGAYAIQGGASKFVHRIEGCYFNVVGLPIAHVYSFIRSSLR